MPSESFYDDALDNSNGGSEFSEISARAYFSRAKTRTAIGTNTGASADLHQSFEIYNKLNEPEFAAQARWEELVLNEALPKHALRMLSRETYRVRVKAIERFLSDAAISKKRAQARRADPPDEYWNRVIKEIRRDVIISNVEW
jgi:hypothetical protein